MIDMLALSIGVGLVVSLLFSQVFGFTAGGMVVPGYFALFLAKPWDIGVTLGVGIATFALVHALSSVVIIYGRRRTALMILFGYLLGMLVRLFAADALGVANADASVIGYIIPGLIAIWLDRQGVVETLCSLVTASVVVRLILVLVVGAELQI